MEKVIEKLKKFRVLIIIAVLLISGVILWFVLRSTDTKQDKPAEDGNDNRVGYYTDTDYPVYITDNGNSLTVELDGSKSSDLRWETAIDNENNLWIKEENEDSDGRFSCVFDPAMEGYTTVTFTRSGDVMGTRYTAVKINVNVIIIRNGNDFRIRVSDVNQKASDMGAADTETPYIIENNELIFPNAGDWSLEPENADDLPEGLYVMTKKYDPDNRVLGINVTFNSNAMFRDDGTVIPEALSSVLILKSESLGIEKKLECVLDERKEWVLKPLEEEENAGD